MSASERDRRMVRRMIEGDEEAFEEFADAHLPALIRFACRRLDGNRELAEEIVQITVCKAIPKLSSYRGEAAFMTWLCACCRNEIAAHFRRQKRRGTEVELEVVEEGGVSPTAGATQARWPDDPEAGVLRGETAELVHDTLDSLPPHYGQALEWKYLERLSVRDIGKRLGLGEKAAESLLTRARKAFREGHTRLLAAARAPAPMAAVAGGRMELES